MGEFASPLLHPWANFYTMTGSSAAALTGLMFIVITIVTGLERVRKNPEGIATYSTPTVMHLGAALLLSAVLLAPWRSLGFAVILTALVGLWGIVYVARVTYRSTRMTGYKPDLEDRVWYSILPFAAYAVTFAGAIGLLITPRKALFGVAAGTVFLLFIGIRNAWDVVTFVTMSPDL